MQIAADLAAKARTAGVVCRAVVADCFYGNHDDLRARLRQDGWGFLVIGYPSARRPLDMVRPGVPAIGVRVLAA
ncbi:hypothetical protein [Plantactinospora sp. DSM 117369]